MLMAQFKPTQGSQHSSFRVRSGTSISFLQDARGLGLSVHLQCALTQTHQQRTTDLNLVRHLVISEDPIYFDFFSLYPEEPL